TQSTLLLDHLMGATIHIIDPPLGPDLDDLLLQKAEELRQAGRRPFVWDRISGRPIAAVSYALCLAEILEEIRQRDIEPGVIYVAAAGATGAGLALSKPILGYKGPIRLVCPIRWPGGPAPGLAESPRQTGWLL